MKRLFIPVLLFLLIQTQGQKLETENVILITLDGYRWQELFSGAEERLICKEFVSDSAKIRSEYWSDSAEKRRQKLTPFFWDVIAKQGQLYGNRNLGSKVNLSNKQWFSYPGYSEILTGKADDSRINSNDKFLNPNTTVLEFLNRQNGFNGRIAAFTSWDVFPFIINSQRSGVPVNAGIIKAEGQLNENQRFLNELMFQVPNPLGDVRLDAFTFHYALNYLESNQPRVLYIAFDETDDFAHGGKYDLYLHAAHYTDQFIAKLWNWCQSTPAYSGKTTMIITTDHGRGCGKKEDWKHHGIKMDRADEIWFAIIGPDTPASGELQIGQWYQNQVAASIASFLSLDFNPKEGTGNKIAEAFSLKKPAQKESSKGDK